ncbi:MAG: hypothetical protein ABJD07_12795 [Gemmatimonadaceae bacterium]
MSWRAVITALDEGVELASRVSVYLHPLAGWPIVWHVVRAVATTDPRPTEIVVLHRASIAMSLPADGDVPLTSSPIERGTDIAALRAALSAVGAVALVDGAAPLVAPSTIARILRAGDGALAALSIDDELASPLVVGGQGALMASLEDPRRPVGARRVVSTDADEMVRVCDRHTLAQAATALQRRLIRAHEERGVTFMLPSTTWVDADVRIGADSVIYPGAVLEGRTEIGSECVIGPHSRLVDATIGNGVELKGWNYVTRASVRSHAVLEPYVRRGFD